MIECTTARCATFLLLLFLSTVCTFQRRVLPQSNKFKTQIMAQSAQSSITIRTAENSDIDKIANLLASHMFDEEIAGGQRRELARLGRADLDARYSERMGRRALPSILLVCEEGNDIIGAVGIDCRVLDSRYKKFRMIKATDDITQLNLVPYLANLVVRKDKRKMGLATKLLKASESFAEGWGFDDIYLMVDARNSPAQKLYQSRGYKEIFRDDSASCLTPSPVGLKTEPCINLCFKKNMKDNERNTMKNGSFLRSIFGSLFK